MFGCCRAPAARASRMKRSCESADRPSRGSSLRATKRRMTESYAFQHARAGADHGPRAEQCADRRLGMIADQTPQELQTGLEARSRDVESHPTVRVLHVRRDRPRAEVGPAADHTMADEAVVRLV